MSTPPNDAIEQPTNAGRDNTGSGREQLEFGSPFGDLRSSWRDLQTDQRSLQYAQAGDRGRLSDVLPAVDLVQRPAESFTANGTETPKSLAENIAGNLSPKPDQVGRYRIAEAIALANGMGHDSYSEFGAGKEVKVPEIDKDGKMVVSDGKKDYEIWTNGAYREHAIGDDSRGRGWDTLGKDGGREYRFEKLPNGSERRTYMAGGHEDFDKDGLGGTGVTSSGEGKREYSFKINSDGSQTRTYTDNGDQQKINADGSSVYKHIDSNDPSNSFLRINDSTKKNSYEFDIPKELSQKSVEQITRDLAVKNWGDGVGNLEANAALLNQAVSDAYARGGDKAVQALAKEIQSLMKARNPEAESTSFKLTDNGPGNYLVDREIMLPGNHFIAQRGGVRFTPKEFH